jgi:anti-sigma B factor antagonist
MTITSRPGAPHRPSRPVSTLNPRHVSPRAHPFVENTAFEQVRLFIFHVANFPRPPYPLAASLALDWRIRNGSEPSMSLQVQSKTLDGAVVISCSGNLTLGAAASLFRNTLRDILKTGTKKILIDLGEVKYLDSSGIGEFVGGYHAAHAAGARLILIRLPDKIINLLKITRLDSVFEIKASEQEALAS